MVLGWWKWFQETGSGFIAILLALTTSVPAASDVLIKISTDAVEVASNLGQQLWYGSGDGVYRVDQLRPRLVSTSRTTTLAEIGGEIWIGTGRGVSRISTGLAGQPGSPELLDVGFQDPEIPPLVRAIRSAEEAVWIETDRGLFRWENGNGERVETPRNQVYATLVVEGKLWIYDSRSVYIHESSGDDQLPWMPISVSENGYAIDRLFLAGGAVWVTTVDRDYRQPGPCYQIALDGSRNSRSISPQLGVVRVKEVASQAWLLTATSLYRVVDRESLGVEIITAADAAPGIISDFEIINGKAWVLAGGNPFRLSSTGHFEAVPGNSVELQARGLVRSEGRLWIWGRSGLYRFEENAKIGFSTTALPVLGLKINPGSIFRVTDIGYVDNDERPLNLGILQGNFRVAVQTNGWDLNKSIREDSFESAFDGEYGAVIPVGVHKIHIAVRDDLGNIRIKPPESIWVLPGAMMLTVVVGLFGSGVLTTLIVWLFGLICCLFAPVSLTFMSLVNHRFNKGSLGMIPFALIFPAMRRHLLRRYCRHAVVELEGAPMDLLGSMPEGALRVHRDLSTKRQLLVIGEASATRQQACSRLFVQPCVLHSWSFRSSVLWILLAHLYLRPGRCLSRLCSWKRTLRLRKMLAQRRSLYQAVPIHLDLKTYLSRVHDGPRVEDLMDSILAKLANYGDINDKSLSNHLLDHGDFIFILDGIDQLDGRGRRVVRRFVDRYKRENFFVVGSSSSSHDFDQYGPVYKLLTEPNTSLVIRPLDGD